MVENIMLPKPFVFLLDKASRWIVSNYLAHPYNLSGSDLGLFYKLLASHADLIEERRKGLGDRECLEELIGYTKGLLYTDEMQAGWHVLSRSMDHGLARYLLDEKLAQRYVLDNYSEFKQKLYGNRIWFVTFIDEREQCITRLGESGIIDPDSDLLLDCKWSTK